MNLSGLDPGTSFSFSFLTYFNFFFKHLVKQSLLANIAVTLRVFNPCLLKSLLYFLYLDKFIFAVLSRFSVNPSQRVS